MKFCYYIFICLILFSCKAKVPIVDYSNAPDWVKNHPMSNENFVGVGVAKKKGKSDYKELAINSAYNEISSEISVSVSSNTFLQQHEKDGSFNEVFDNVTKTFTSNHLLGCKQISKWENNEEYWVYYVLSKESVEAQKQESIEDAKISLNHALKHGRNNDLSKAIAYYAIALASVKPYLGDRLKTDFDGETIFLGQFILDNYLDLISSVKLDHDIKELKILNRQFIPPFNISVSLNGNLLNNIPIKIDSKTANYTGIFSSNDKGVISLPLLEIEDQPSATITFSINTVQLLQEAVLDDLVILLLKDYEPNQLKLNFVNEPLSVNGNGKQQSNSSCNLASRDDEKSIISELNRGVFSNEKIQIAKTQLKKSKKCFSPNAIKNIVTEIALESDRLEFLKYSYSFCSDKNDFYEICVEALVFTKNKSELQSFIDNQK